MAYPLDTSTSFAPLPNRVMEGVREHTLISNAEYLRLLRLGEPVTAQPVAVKTLPQESTDREKRQNIRYRCQGSVEFCKEGSEIRSWATITDISRSGCYVEMQATFPRDTVMNMVIEVNGIRTRVKGLVHVSYPFLGMGIAFTEITTEESPLLEELLLTLAGGFAAPILTHPETAVTSSVLKDPLLIVQKLTAFYQVNSVLTREQFNEIIGKISR